MDRIVVREKEIKGTKITLWKNVNKYENTYSISISKKNMIYMSVVCQNKRSLPDAVSKYDSILEWVNYLVNKEEEQDGS